MKLRWVNHTIDFDRIEKWNLTHWNRIQNTRWRWKRNHKMGTQNRTWKWIRNWISIKKKKNSSNKKEKWKLNPEIKGRMIDWRRKKNETLEIEIGEKVRTNHRDQNAIVNWKPKQENHKWNYNTDRTKTKPRTKKGKPNMKQWEFDFLEKIRDREKKLNMRKLDFL